MATTSVEAPATDDAVLDPSVLVVLVVHDGARWLPECLRSLAAQRYPRLGVVAVDNASRDGSSELLAKALGERRVLTLPEDRGVAGALLAASELPAAQAADYVLLIHDDTALAPDAVARLVEAAQGIHGIERVGVVGPKVVDWDDPRVLREVGRSVDAFGHPYSPLQEGERDQGQYDRVLEVLFVSSCAMLISREALQRTGRFDERYGGHHDDLDFCWRARVAGFRVLMTPTAQARHRGASVRGERATSQRHRSSRYYAERSGLSSMLKAYGVVTLLWLLPLYAVAGIVRLFLLGISRRFEDAYDLLVAWGWNLLHLPGTIRRRVRVQSVRTVRDHHVRRFMASAFRTPRWFERAEEILDEQLEEGEEEPRRLRDRAASLALAHPVLVAAVLAAAFGALAVRHFFGPEVLGGGALAAFPAQASGFGSELLSGTRTTVLGGVQSASPALAPLGALSWLTFGTALAQKVLLAALPPIAAASMYRALSRQTQQPFAAVAGAVSYGLSSLAMWSFSEGRIPALVLIAIMPVVWDGLDSAFSTAGPERAMRAIVALGVAVAVGIAFFPGSLLAVGPILVVMALAAPRRARGLAIAAAAVVTATALVFPVLPSLVEAPASELSSLIGSEDVWSILRLAPGGGPGTWVLAAFLPIAALICFALVAREYRGRAWRALIASLAGLGLAWASIARWLPDALTNQVAYLSIAGVGMALLIGYGVATLRDRIGREEFGFRQISAALLAVVLAVGVGSQTIQGVLAEWAVQPEGLPPAWPVVSASAPGSFRIVWLGSVQGDPFPAPGGDPIGIVQAGASSVRYAITDRDGTTALDTGRGTSGPGYGFLADAVEEVVAGATRHGGRLLAPLGVRFLVAAEGDLPPGVVGRLEQQLDLYAVPAGGLTIYRNPVALPVASVVRAPGFGDTVGSGGLPELAALPELTTTPLAPSDGGWSGVSDGGLLFVGEQYAGGWQVDSGGTIRDPRVGLGWALSAPVDDGQVEVDFTMGWVRVTEMVILGVLWVAALWITRKPVSQ